MHAHTYACQNGVGQNNPNVRAHGSGKEVKKSRACATNFLWFFKGDILLEIEQEQNSV